MTKDVIISISGLQVGEGVDGEPIEVITTGEYFYKNGKHYLLFEELVEGERQSIKSRVKISEDGMELTKSGAVHVHMVFDKGHKNLTHYDTAYGSLLIGIDTRRILLQEAEDELNVEVDYILEFDQRHGADCSIKINVKSQGNEKFKLS